MAQRSRTGRKDHGSQYAIYALIAGLAVALAVAIGYSAMLQGYMHGHAVSAGSASIDVKVVSPPSMVSRLLVGIHGSGMNLSVPMALGPGQPAVPTTANASNYSVPINANESEGNVLFANLLPDSAYVITLTGSTRPYCAPGEICPMYILAVNRSENVQTGPAGSVVNITMSM